MVMFDGAFGLLMFAVWIFCIIDVITTPQDRCRNLPKIAWLLLVVILTAVGSIAWLVAGRPWQPRSAAGTLRPADAPAKRVAPTNPDDDEEFLAQLRARAEEQRRRARDADPRDDEPNGGTG